MSEPTLYIPTREEWKKWLENHYDTELRIWSKHNVRRVEKMIAEGKMTNKGMELYKFAIDNGLLPESGEKPEMK